MPANPYACHNYSVQLAADGQDWTFEIAQLLYRIELTLVEQEIVRGLIRAGVRVLHPGYLGQQKVEVAHRVRNRR